MEAPHRFCLIQGFYFTIGTKPHHHPDTGNKGRGIRQQDGSGS
jgi:hypothetical protein